MLTKVRNYHFSSNSESWSISYYVTALLPFFRYTPHLYNRSFRIFLFFWSFIFVSRSISYLKCSFDSFFFCFFFYSFSLTESSSSPSVFLWYEWFIVRISSSATLFELAVFPLFSDSYPFYFLITLSSCLLFLFFSLRFLYTILFVYFIGGFISLFLSRERN